MPFTVPTFLVETNDGRNFTLRQEVVYFTEVRGGMEKITLPAGCTSDGGSIPEACWSLPGLQPFGPLWRWYYLHDALYRDQAVTEGQPWTREEADLMLLDGMLANCIPVEQREAIYHAVREFGQPAWDKGHPPKV